MFVLKVKSDRHKQTTAAASPRANRKTGQSQKSGTRVGGKDSLASGDAGLKDSVACLTSEQLQHILNTVETTSNGQDPPEDHKSQGRSSDEYIKNAEKRKCNQLSQNVMENVEEIYKNHVFSQHRS